MKKLGFVLLLLGFPVVSWSQEPASNKDIDRSGFGNNPWPIWSELSPFEANTVDALTAAKSNDPNTLLGLYLLASGDTRDSQQYLQYLQEIDTWLNSIEKKLQRKKQPGDKAEFLYLEMREHFFLGGNDIKQALLGYDGAQSQISQIFETQRYNCISSSLLYLVLLHKIGLTGQGVLVPSHAFVQLDFDSEIIEVETTSATGFDTVHDKQFYDANAQNWFDERGLDAPTYADYQQREIVSAYELGLYNMMNQHIGRERMDYQDRLRIAEIRGHQLADDEIAQTNRLSYYLEEIVYLHRQNDFQTAALLFKAIDPYLAGLGEKSFSSKDFHEGYTKLTASIAKTYFHTGNAMQGLNLVEDLLTQLTMETDADTIRYIVASTTVYGRQLIKKKQFKQAKKLYDTIDPYCTAYEFCLADLAFYYSNLAVINAEEKRWELAIEQLNQYLSIDSNSVIATKVRGNLEQFYVSWADYEEWEGEWESALDKLEKCIQSITQAPNCKKAKSAINNKLRQGFY